MRNEKRGTKNEKREMTINNQKNQKKKSPNWIDKNKFKEILTIIDSNKFSYKNKIGEFKYDKIKDLVNNIRNNTISKIDTKKDLDKLKKNKKCRNNKI